MPIECSCPACEKRFRVKDELAGKKFKCTACGAVVPAEPSRPAARQPDAPAAEKKARPQRPAAASAKPPTGKKPVSAAARRKRAAADGTTAGERAAKKKRPAKKKTRSKPDPFGDDHRDADPEDLFGQDYEDDHGEAIDDYGDDYTDDGYAADPYSNPAPRPKKKKSAAKSKRSKKKSSSGWNIGFNINRINIALLVGGGILIFLGINEARLAAQSNSTPQTITLAELLQNRPDSIYLTVTGVVSSEGGYIAEESTAGRLRKIWAPAHPPGSQNANFILYSTRPRSEGDADMLLSGTSFTGMITNDIRSLGSEEKQHLRTIPGVNVDTAIIFEIGRKPSGALAVILYFIAGLAVLGGGAAWIFLTGRD